jgi:hypothetical protein
MEPIYLSESILFDDSYDTLSGDSIDGLMDRVIQYEKRDVRLENILLYCYRHYIHAADLWRILESKLVFPANAALDPSKIKIINRYKLKTFLIEK